MRDPTHITSVLRDVLRGVVLALCLFQVSLRGDLPFDDTFKHRIDEGWSWLRENPGAWRLTDDGLQVRVEPGNMWGPANNARNVLLRPVPKEFAEGVAISVTVKNSPTEQYEQANLVWYYDDSHMVKLGQELVDGRLSIVMGREENDKARTIAIIPTDLRSVRLRFLVAGNQIRGQFRSLEDKDWKEAGECDLPVRGNPKISLQFYQGPAHVVRWAGAKDFRMEVWSP